MLRLTKYLKPYAILILFSVVLLFVQAITNLQLPDYMSNIVNIGIQQGGIQNAVPQAIRQNTMNDLTLFMSAADKTRVLGDYTLIDKNSPDYGAYVKDYPDLTNGPIYVLKSIDQSEVDAINPVMGKAFLVFSFIQQIQANPSQAATLGQSLGFNISALPAGTNLFTLLAQLPAAQFSQISTAINQKFATMDPSLINQTAVIAVKAEYTALGMNTGKIQSNYLEKIGLIMMLITLISGIATVLVGYLSTRTGAGAARDMRKDLFARVESFSNVEFDRFSTASLVTRSTNDITQVQMVIIMFMRMVLLAPIQGIGGIILALGQSTSMWWVIALGVLVLLGIVLIVFSISMPKFRIMQSLIDRLNLVVRENLSGMMVIRAFNKQQFEEDRFDKANIDLTQTSLFVNRVMVFMFPVMMLIMNGLTLAIVWVGAHQVAESTMQVGNMIAFLQYAMIIVMSFLMMSFMFIMVPRASVAGGRIADVIETKPVIVDPKKPESFRTPFYGTIEFRDVTFRYPGALEDALHNISFTAEPGQTTAFIGPTGSGKTTIINLIPRFYEVSHGAIYVDGTDVRQVSQHDLRDKIGYVPQKSTLFSGTIESNLLYADEDASAETLNEAADIAQASEFINSRPERMSADIAQGGANVSGGQKQRLSIARALVKKAPIYIFDDSFSALDFKTDSALRRAMKEKTSSSTLLIVTQRVSTIKNADQIVVIEEGKIVGKGKHNELMQNCQTYREIALSQLSKEELS